MKRVWLGALLFMVSGGIYASDEVSCINETGFLRVESSNPTAWKSHDLCGVPLEGGQRYGLELTWRTLSSETNTLFQISLVPSHNEGEHWRRVYELEISPKWRSVQTTFLLPEGASYIPKVQSKGAIVAELKDVKLTSLPRLTDAEIHGTNRLSQVDAVQFEPLGVCDHFDRLKSPGRRPSGWSAYTDDELKMAFDLLDATPTQWTRLSITWNSLEPEKGHYDSDYLGRIDQVVDHLDRLGIKYYIQIGGPARWASSSSATDKFWTYPPKDWEDWEAVVRFLGERYSGRCTHWELLNESDYEHFWKGTVEDYVMALKKGHSILKKLRSDIKILNTGLSSDGVLSARSINQQFLQKMFDLGAGEYIDIFSQHMYTVDVETAIYRVNRFYSVMKKNGQGHKPIWITEIGMSTFSKGKPVRSFADQQKYLEDIYTVLARHPIVEKVFWYNFRSKGDLPADKESNFGIFNRDFSPRPAGDSYLNLKAPKARMVNQRFLEIDGL